MGKPESVVRAVVATFQERQRQLRVDLREAGVELPPQVRANMSRVLARVRDIAVSCVEKSSNLDPEDIVDAIDKADRTHRALTRFKVNL